ncbi:transglycosylase SLT domain-containing protein [Microbacterium koreense]|uniref:Transglycosylase SLT domain-containing protein n=1 Tax=Microbacterium koreense TaxID=323761 RepID=A0ABW2ZS07_9MICO
MPTRWSRRRGVLGVFAAFAAVGFVAAYAGPTGLAISQANADENTSLFASSLEHVQARDGDATAEPAEIDLDRDGYTVYVKPKPTPTPEPQTSSQGASAPTVAFAPPPYTGGGSPAQWMGAAGIAQSDWGYVDFIVSRESGWNPNATNRSSGACGLVQVYPCGKLANAYDPVVNLQWANGYANGRYGSWANAVTFWVNNHWW